MNSKTYLLLRDFEGVLNDLWLVRIMEGIIQKFSRYIKTVMYRLDVKVTQRRKVVHNQYFSPS